ASRARATPLLADQFFVDLGLLEVFLVVGQWRVLRRSRAGDTQLRIPHGTERRGPRPARCGRDLVLALVLDRAGVAGLPGLTGLTGLARRRVLRREAALLL